MFKIIVTERRLTYAITELWEKIKSTFALASHNHDNTYAAKNHSHGDTYAAKNHNHDNSYASINHGHTSSSIRDVALDKTQDVINAEVAEKLKEIKDLACAGL